MNYTFEVDGEEVNMMIESAGKNEEEIWRNVVSNISKTALPDNIFIGKTKKTRVQMDKIVVSLMREAALLIRRIDDRLSDVEIKKKEKDHLTKLRSSLLFDIPALLKPDMFKGLIKTTKNN